MLEKHWEFNKPVHQLLVSFSKVHDWAIRDKMYEVQAHQSFSANYVYRVVARTPYWFGVRGGGDVKYYC